MKFKRFLSLAVALAMVIAMIPAFSLTASAADTSAITLTEWKTYAGDAVFNYPTNLAGGDRVVSEYGTGWSSSWNGTNNESDANGTANININGNGKYFQVYGPAGSVDTLELPNFGEGKDFVIFEGWWTRPIGGANASFYHDFAIKDIDGKIIETGSISRTDGLYSGASAGGTHTYASVHPTPANAATVNTKVHTGYHAGIRMLFVNNDDETYSVIYYTAGTAANKEYNEDTYLNTYQNNWSNNWYKAYTATYEGQFNGLGAIEYTVRGNGSAWYNNHSVFYPRFYAGNVPAVLKSVTATYVANGETIKEETKSYDAEVEAGATFAALEYSANGSNVLYSAEETVLAESAEIEMTAVANVGTHAVGDIVAVNGVQYEIKGANLIPNADFAYGTAGWFGGDGKQLGVTASNGTIKLGNAGGGNTKSLNQSWAIEEGKTYYFTYKTSSANKWHITSLQNELKADENTTNNPVLVGATNGDKLIGTLAASDVAGTNNFVFTNTAGYAYLQSAFRWSDSTFSEFGLYEVAEAEVVISETVATVAEIASVKVIGDTTVVLPGTVHVTGSLGTEINAPIVWNAPESYNVGTAEVTGTATIKFGEQEATTQAVSTTVTVLEETFALSDLTSVNGQTAAKEEQRNFPVALTDEFSIEFIANYASFGDLFITLKTKDAGFFGPEQIALGANASGSFRPVDGNGTGGRNTNPDKDLAALTTGTNYRFFIETDASTGKYTATVFDATTGVEVAKAANFGYRTNAAAIECIAALTNNGNGEVTVSNIKVNANVEKTEYTVNITKDGETTTATAYFWSDEEAKASIADIEGYEKTVTIEGTTINVVYSATKTITVTFITSDETVIHAVTEEVQLDGAVTVAEAEIYDTVTCAYYVIPETTATETTVVTVAPVENKYAVVADAFHNAGDAQPWNNDDNMLFVGSAGVTNIDDVDANGDATHNGGGNLGSARVALVKFPVPEVNENQAVKLNLYVAKANQNLGNGSWMKIAANVSAVEANETENPYVAGDLVNLDGMVWSDNAVSAKSEPVSGRMEVNEWVEIDVTNFVKAATGETITFALYVPTAGFYVADREKAVMGGAYQGKAAYLSLEDAFVVTATGDATLTKNGTAMTTAYTVEGDDVRLVADGAVVVNTDAGYYEANKNLNLTVATDFANTVPAGFGLAMVNGGQVRIGTTELEDGDKLDAMADSGLRFLATADYADTVLADEAVEFGIKVTAESSDKVAYVKADTFQNDDNNVFSAAITNLKESNYNRKYTAVAYALVPMADGTTKEFTTDSVTRSIYQVSAGIMKNGSADADNAPYTVDGVVKNILNAYVNQTGIRLSYTADGITVEEGKYTGDVFFTVESTVNADGSVAVTITPDASWGTPAEIASWWTDYVRVNNNNSVAKTYISDAAVVDGVLTFTFTVPASN